MSFVSHTHLQCCSSLPKHTSTVAIAHLSPNTLPVLLFSLFPNRQSMPLVSPTCPTHTSLLRNLCPVSSAEPALTSCSSGQRWPSKLHFWSFQFSTGWVVGRNFFTYKNTLVMMSGSYRNSHGTKAQTLLSPSLKNQTVPELFVHHQLESPQWRPGEGSRTPGLQIRNHLPKRHLIHMCALPSRCIYT